MDKLALARAVKELTRRTDGYYWRPVASAVLYVFEEISYLSLALTAGPFRCRGAQSADSPSDRKGGGARLQDRRFGNPVDPGAFTGQPAKGGVQPRGK